MTSLRLTRSSVTINLPYSTKLPDLCFMSVFLWFHVTLDSVVTSFPCRESGAIHLITFYFHVLSSLSLTKLSKYIQTLPPERENTGCTTLHIQVIVQLSLSQQVQPSTLFNRLYIELYRTEENHRTAWGTLSLFHVSLGLQGNAPRHYCYTVLLLKCVIRSELVCYYCRKFAETSALEWWQRWYPQL